MPNGIFTLKQQVDGLRQGAWTNQKTPFVNYLVVAGGGSTGGYGGGGAGGLLQGVLGVSSGSAITATVGAGGAAGGGNGSNSVFGAITANGGGSASTAGSGNGNSDGGRGFQGTRGQGNSGGNAMYAPTYYLASGGGGAGTQGLSSVSAPGAGGSGIASDISGTRTAYAGGGGGGQAYAGDYNTPGGAGGGGDAGGTANSYVAQSGAANTGGGAGGTSYAPGSNAGNPAGGSGIVIISYPDTYLAPTATTGSPTVSTSGSGSIGFNGSNQAFSYAGQTGFVLGTGDFTIEFWVYLNSLTGFPTIVDLRDTSNTGNGPVLYYNTGVGLEYFSNGSTRISGGTLSTGQWYHIALARSGTATKLFVNGSQVGSTYTDSTNYACAATAPRIGVNGAGNSGWVNGNISNLRFVKGTAVYTTTFTPSTTPLTAITNTTLLLNSVSGAYLADGSTNAYAAVAVNTVPAWNQLSPFATGLGYKNRVYTWTSSGSITF